MGTSILLAPIIGPTFLIIGLGALLNPTYYGAMIRNFVKDAELYYFSGALALISGISPVRESILGMIEALDDDKRQSLLDDMRDLGARGE